LPASVHHQTRSWTAVDKLHLLLAGTAKQLFLKAVDPTASFLLRFLIEVCSG
jgi:hypothetical protein